MSVLTRTFQKVGVLYLLCLFFYTMSSYQRFDNNNDEEEGGGVTDMVQEEISDNLDQNIDFQKQTPKNDTSNGVVDININMDENSHNSNSTKKRNDYDHIEVSLEDPTESREIITRASDFFLEYNDNFRMSWKETVELDQKRELDDDLDLDVDPSKPPQQGWNKEYLRSLTALHT